MRSTIKTILPMALLSASLLFGACGGESREEAAGYEAETGAAEDARGVQELPGDPEAAAIEGPERDVVIVDTEADHLAELEERERRLAERRAELEKRERRLRETPPARETPRETPAPAPEREPVAERREAEAPRETEAQAEAQAQAEAGTGDRDEPAYEPAETRAERERPEAPQERERRLVTSVAVPDGTVLSVRFTEEVSSNGSRVGDTFRTRVASDIVEGGRVVIPAGSEILGEVSEAVPLDRRIGGQARLTLRFTDLVLPSGTAVPIRASFLRQGRNETGRDAAVIGGGAAGGAVLGRILGGKGDRSRGTLVGAILGAAAGAVIASRTPGEEVVIPDGATVDLVLDEEVEVRIGED